MKKIYVVNYKETTIDENNVMNVESGVCDFGYVDEEDAIKKCWELSDEKMNEFLADEGENLYRDTENDGDWQCVHHYQDTYEYWVTIVDIEM